MGKRFAIVISVAAAGVMALGAQTAAGPPSPALPTYDTELTIALDRANFWHGFVKSEVRKCERGQSVNLFRQRPGTDAKLGKDTRTEWAGRWPWGQWLIQLQQRAQVGWRVYAKVTPKKRDQFVCLADRSPTYTVGAQPAVAVVKYDTTLTLTKDQGGNYHGRVYSDRDRNPEYDPAKAVRKCMGGRQVTLFKLRPGADRKLDTVRSRRIRPSLTYAVWWMDLGQRHDYGDRVRARVERKVGNHFVCRADRATFGY